MHIRILSGYGLAYDKFCCGGMLFSRWQLRNLLWCLSSNEHHEMSIDARSGTRRSWILMVKLDWHTNFTLNLGSPSAKLIRH